MGQDLGGLVFFSLIREYVKHQLDTYLVDALGRMIGLVGAVAITLATLWIMIQGYRIMTGQSREPLIGFVVNAGKVVLILSIATSSALYNSWIRESVEDIRDAVTYVMTGSDQDVYRQVDKNLALTQTVLSAVNSISVGGGTGGATDPKIATEQQRVWYLSAFGSGGPAIIAGMVSMLNEIMFTFALALGPLFLLGLMFEQTKPLFWNWVKYMFGLMASMGALAFLTGLVLKVSIGYATTVAAAVLLKYATNVDLSQGVSMTQTAMVQGGLGLVFSTLLVTVPPMLMNFFSVSLGGGVSGYGPFSGNAPPGTGINTGGKKASDAPETTPDTPGVTGSLNNQTLQNTLASQSTDSTSWGTMRTQSAMAANSYAAVPTVNTLAQRAALKSVASTNAATSNKFSDN